MNAEILSVGTELLMGELVDTNSSFIASRLPALGINLRHVSLVGDDMETLVGAVKRGLERSDIIFTSGGLGPTQDDLTRDAVAAALGEQMEVQKEIVEQLRAYFRRRGGDMPATNIRQASLIPSAEIIPNARGTAPGWWVECNDKRIVTMPGPPAELQAIWEAEVVPRLRKISRGDVILTRNIKTSGMSEGAVDELVTDYLGKENPYLGIYSKADGIHLRIIARGADETSARSLLQPVEDGLVSIMGPYIWGYDDETPQQAVGDLLVAKGLSLSTMEHCTGGVLASSISETTGTAEYYHRGLVVYGRESAVGSGVSAEVIDAHGLVSPETAQAMARAAAGTSESGADVGIGITGVLGPDEVDHQPPGVIHIALVHPPVSGESVTHIPLRLPPRPLVIRRRASSTALIELRRILNML